MARKKKSAEAAEAFGSVVAEATLQPITETIETNYMPYAMSVIISRAIPEIDGFKPSHRKLLYTMYEMGLLTGPRTKSANVVGQTMHLNPHGDAAIYETMVRLTRGNEALLHPFVDSKGSFGKQYSRDMAYAASRYTEVKLDSFCQELFRGIDHNAVDMVPNYDNTTVEPTLLPTTFPNILISPNMGIAVGIACNICSFNLAEICDGTVALLKNPNTPLEKMMELIKAPDFPGGGQLLYEKEQMTQVFTKGNGSIRLRARYRYDPEQNCIDILQIPYSSCIESIMKKIGDMIKEGKLREVTDFRDEIDLNGFKLTLDLRRGTDPEKLMRRLFRQTELENSFDCNFNVLIDGTPRQLGVVDILKEWIRFRQGCLQRELTFDLGKKRDKQELLMGLGLILLDIDKAISIIRHTEKDEDVVPNLMAGFDLNRRQAEYVADIKLRNINKEYIAGRISELESLQNEIAELEEILQDELKLKAKMAEELRDIKKKYGKPRKTLIIGAEDLPEEEEEEEVENYDVRLVLTHDGYFKKITAQSLRGNDEQKVKEGDYITYMEDTDNLGTMFFITNKAQAYRMRVADFDVCKASSMGEFVAGKIGMEEGEYPVFGKVLKEYPENRYLLFIFANGKGVRVPLSAYLTKSNRKKLTGACSAASPLAGVFYEETPLSVLLRTNADRAITISSELVPIKETRTSAGVSLIQLKAKQEVTDVRLATDGTYAEPERYRKRKIPAAGVLLSEKDIGKMQQTLDV